MGWRWPSIKDEFFQDLARLHKICGPWDLILFTGDLTNEADFGKLDEEIEEIRQKVAELSNGEKPILLAVPGNHDLKKPPQDNPLVEKLQQWSKDEKVRSDFWEKDFYRPVVEESFQNYQGWWEPYFNALGNDYRAGPLRVKDAPKKGLLPGDFSVTIEKEGCRLGIIGLNTSFLHMLPGRKARQIALHTDQFAEVCGGDGPRWVRERHACLLMTHHPPEWLDEDSEKNHLLGEIQPQNRFVAHLCGHVHKASYEPSKRLFRACSLFGLKSTENGDDRKHGYAAGRIDLHDTKGKLYFWPRAARKEEHVMRLQEDDSDSFFLNNKSKHTQSFEFDLSKPCTGKSQIRDIPEPGSPYSPDFCVRRTSLVGRALVQLRKGGSKPHEPPVFWGPRGFGKRWLLQGWNRRAPLYPFRILLRSGAPYSTTWKMALGNEYFHGLSSISAHYPTPSARKPETGGASAPPVESYPTPSKRRRHRITERSLAGPVDGPDHVFEFLGPWLIDQFGLPAGGDPHEGVGGGSTHLPAVDLVGRGSAAVGGFFPGKFDGARTLFDDSQIRHAPRRGKSPPGPGGAPADSFELDVIEIGCLFGVAKVILHVAVEIIQGRFLFLGLAEEVGLGGIGGLPLFQEGGQRRLQRYGVDRRGREDVAIVGKSVDHRLGKGNDIFFFSGVSGHVLFLHG